MRILVTGSSGFIGSALVEALGARGDEVRRLVRREPSDEGEVHWDPASGCIDAAGLEGIDAAVHLAGENIVGRWTRRKKARIRDSRILGTGLLSRTLAGLDRPPQVLASASGIGYYGSRGDEELSEQSAPGGGFLADMCRQWEGVTAPASDAGIRVVHLRFPMVLSRDGGALAAMLMPFRLGLGGVMGNGRQYWSYIALDDALAAVAHALDTPSIRGPLNVAAPNPVTNREFTRALGRVLRRPTLFRVPAFAARLSLGQMADEMLLASARVLPERLTASGFSFGHPTLEPALRHLL
jgi:hypothetical protein